MGSPSPPRRLQRLLWILATLLVAVPAGIGVWNALATERRISAALNARTTQGTLDGAVSGVTRLRVWGAGMRTGGDHFCGCALVPRPERVYYETADLSEIREFLSRIRPRPYLTLDPQVATCGQITIDLLRGEQRLLSIHLLGVDLRSTKGLLPVTQGSVDAIEDWLSQRSIREKIRSAMTEQLERKK
ncbi:MAG TPA: hypothetical protein VKW04_13210 [Planctomycetota bacterium]|nr:hypothetical protein [Planctomycetota bacterium]